MRHLIAFMVLLLSACGGGSDRDLKISFSYGVTEVEWYRPVSFEANLSGLEGNRPSCRVASGALPAGITVNSDCSVSGTPTRTGSFTSTVELTVSGYRGSVSTGLLFYVSPPSVTLFQPRYLLNLGQPYPNAFGRTYYFTPDVDHVLTLEITSGRLPAGLSIDAATLTFSGAPQEVGTFKADLVAVFTAGGSVIRLPVGTMEIEVGYPPSGFNYPAPCCVGVVGVPFTALPFTRYAETPGSTATYSLLSPLPAGLSLDPSTGAITGVPEVMQLPTWQSSRIEENVTLPDGTTSKTTAILDYVAIAGPVAHYDSRFLFLGESISVVPILSDGLPGDVYSYAVRRVSRSNASGGEVTSSLPSWLQLDPQSGRLYGVVPEGAVGSVFDLQGELSVTRNGRTFTAASLWAMSLRVATY